MSDHIQLETVLASDLPSDLPDRIVNDIGQFSVGLFGVCDTDLNQPLRPCASGTLVAIKNSPFVLTAAHVWEALKSRKEEDITIILKNSYYVRMQRGDVSDISLGRGKRDEEEWGPDLSLLCLPPQCIDSVSMVKTSYDLSKKRQPARGVDQIEMWLLLGAPGEYANVAVDHQTLTAHASLQMTGFFLKQVQARHRKKGFDYVDIGVVVDSLEVPSTFGGMSGGGLWHVFVSKSAATEQYGWTYTMEGVIFYESPEAGGRCFVRSHGRKSIRLLLKQLEERSG